jgi:hypothetical protein
VPKRLVGVLGTVVWVAIAASSVAAATPTSTPTSTPSARAAPAAKGCTPQPTTLPWWQRWYATLDHPAMSECRPLGPAGRAAQKSAKPPAVHRNASARAIRRAADSPRAAPPAAATQAFAAAPVANGFGPAIPAAPPTENPPPPAAPAPQALISEVREPDVSVPAPAPESAAAPVLPAPQSAPIAEAAHAAATAGEEDHRFALLVLAAALLVIVGPVLGITRLLSLLMARAERRRALRAATAPNPRVDVRSANVGEAPAT